MANEQNLIPFNKRTESERRELAKIAGEKSGVVRRENRTIRKIVDEILKSKTVDSNGNEITRIAKMAQRYVENIDSTLSDGETKPFEAMVELVEGKSVQPVEVDSSVVMTSAPMTAEELLKLSGAFDPDDFDDRDDSSEPDS
jgi:hypothetical protein